MPNMSFAITTNQILAQTKTVTRRLGWLRLQPGDIITPVVKGMGLRKGEKVQRLGGLVRVVSVRREPLRLLLDRYGYGVTECGREGFPNLLPEEFVEMFCRTHPGCRLESEITRIVFEYLEGQA